MISLPICCTNIIVFIYAVEHERMVEAYSMINQKLQNSISEQANLEKTIQELKVYDIIKLSIDPLLLFSVICAYVFGIQAEIRRHERDYTFARKEISDLQREVIEIHSNSEMCALFD